ncbi:MAG TPA: LPS assembly lipoprotein LptE [Candidatus Angelobacter sp.]|nr:LPS assembly lipoprotein LptE [Candidatus Angelobacter sp.]
MKDPAHKSPKQLRPCAFLLIVLIVAALSLAGCGYHAVGRSSRLPENVHVLAVPMFVNQTQTYRVEQLFTRDVVREFIDRTHYRVITDASESADATLKATVLSAQTAPLTYDPQTGRISSALVTVSLKVSLVERGGRVLFDNPNFTFREQYQVSREVTSFFAEETPALQRMSRDFAHTLVSDVLEAF